MADENENNNENKVAEEVAAPPLPVEQQSEPQTEQSPVEPQTAPLEPVLEPQPESISNPNPLEPIPEPAPEIEPKLELASEPNGGIGAPTILESVIIEQPHSTQVEINPTLLPPEMLSQSKSFISNLLAKANYALRLRKIKKLEKIVELARWEKTISNDDIQKMLRVSHNTAARYLTELVRQNKLIRLGHPKHAKYKSL